jgi:serine/threonine-protein kinase SRPK3
MIFDQDELLAEMVRFFGKLPEAWWSKWEARGDFFDARGKWLGDGDDVEGDEREEWSLEVALGKPIEIIQPGKGQDETAKRALATAETEQKLIADLLYKLFRYEPGRRIGVDEVLAHDWFQM